MLLPIYQFKTKGEIDNHLFCKVNQIKPCIKKTKALTYKKKLKVKQKQFPKIEAIYIHMFLDKEYFVYFTQMILGY